MTSELEHNWNTVFGNAMLILAVLPDTGDGGRFPCPACKTGTVHWGRATLNKHVRFECDGCKTKLIQ